MDGWTVWRGSCARNGGNRSVDIHGDYRLAGPGYTKRLAMRAKPRQMRPLPTRLPSQVLGWLSGSQESAGMCVSAEGQPQTSLGVEIPIRSESARAPSTQAKLASQSHLSASQTHQQRTHATSHRSIVENRYQGIQSIEGQARQAARAPCQPMGTHRIPASACRRPPTPHTHTHALCTHV